MQVDEHDVVSSPAVMAVWPRWLAGEDHLRDLLAAELRRGGMPEIKARAAAADNLAPCGMRASNPTSRPNSSTV